MSVRRNWKALTQREKRLIEILESRTNSPLPTGTETLAAQHKRWAEKNGLRPAHWVKAKA